MSQEMKEFVKNAIVNGEDIRILLEYVSGTWFITFSVGDYNLNNFDRKKYFFTSDSRMAQLYIHELERIISDVRYLWCNAEGEDHETW